MANIVRDILARLAIQITGRAQLAQTSVSLGTAQVAATGAEAAFAALTGESTLLVSALTAVAPTAIAAASALVSSGVALESIHGGSQQAALGLQVTNAALAVIPPAALAALTPILALTQGIEALQLAASQPAGSGLAVTVQSTGTALARVKPDFDSWIRNLDLSGFKSEKAAANVSMLRAAMVWLENTLKSGGAAWRSYQARIDAAQAEVSKSIGSFSALQAAMSGLAIVGAITWASSLVHQAIDAAGVIEDTANRLGISTDALQVWTAVAERSGAGVAELGASFNVLARNLTSAREEAGSAREAFEELGLKADALEGGDLADSLGQVLRGLAGVEDGAKRAALAQEILGRGGTKLIPLVAQGTEAFDEQMKALEKLAVVYDARMLKVLGETEDTLQEQGFAWKRLGLEILVGMLPALNALSRGLRWVAEGIQYLGQHTAVFQAALTFLGTIAVYKTLASIGALITRLGGLRVVLGLIGRFVMRALLPFLLLEDIIVMFQGGESAIGAFLDKLGGDGTAKAFVAWVKNAWEEVIGLFDGKGPGILETFGDFFRFLWQDITDGAAQDWAVMVAAFESDLTAFLSVWDTFTAYISEGVWNDIAGAFEAALTWTSGVWDTFVTYVTEALWNDLASAFDGALNAITGAWDSTWLSVVSGFEWMRGIVTEGLSGIYAFAEKVLGVARKAASWLGFDMPDTGEGASPAADGEQSDTGEGARPAAGGEQSDTTQSTDSMQSYLPPEPPKAYMSTPALAPSYTTQNITINQSVSTEINTGATTPAAIKGVAVGTTSDLANRLVRSNRAIAAGAF